MTATDAPVDLEPVAHDTFDAALCAALAELTDPKTDAEADTGQFKYRYAKLWSILSGARPVLGRHEIAVVQHVTTTDDGVGLTVDTTLRHASGGTLSSGPLTVRLPPNPQQIGSAVTYLRRYQLCALLGIAPEDDDDDGQAAAKAPPAKRTTTTARKRAATTDDVPPPTRRAVTELTDAQRRTIMGLFADLGLTGDDMRLARLAFTSRAIGREVTTTNDVTRDEGKALITALIEANRDLGADTVDVPGPDDYDESDGYR